MSNSDISDIFTYCSVVLCAQRVDCRTGFGTHHGARAWVGVACARRYMAMASDGAPSPFTSPMVWPLGAMCAPRRIGIGSGDGSADFFYESDALVQGWEIDLSLHGG